MVSCHHEQALNYKFKQNRANKLINLIVTLISGSVVQAKATRLQSRLIVGFTKVPIISLTIKVDIESTNRAYRASTGYGPRLWLRYLK